MDSIVAVVGVADIAVVVDVVMVVIEVVVIVVVVVVVVVVAAAESYLFLSRSYRGLAFRLFFSQKCSGESAALIIG